MWIPECEEFVKDVLLEFIVVRAFFCVEAVFNLPLCGAIGFADSVQDVCSKEDVKGFLCGGGKLRKLPFNGEKALLEGFDAVELIIIDMAEFLDCFRYLRNVAGVVSPFQVFPGFHCRKILDLVLNCRSDVENDEGSCQIFLLFCDLSSLYCLPYPKVPRM